MAKILIVDDRAESRRYLLTLLGDGQHELLEAADGAEALEFVRRERPNLVITDVAMPKVDGYEFIRRLRSDGEVASTSVIFYTGTYDEPEARQLALAGGVTHILPKPSEPEIILKAVNELLGETLQPAAAATLLLEEFDKEHLRLLTDKLSRKVNELEAEITERKRAEEKLRASEASLAEAQAIAHLGNWELDLTTMQGNCSAEMFRLLHRDPGLGVPNLAEFMEIVHPEDRLMVEENLTPTPDKTEPYSFEYRTYPSLGPVRHLYVTMQINRDASGQPVRMVGTTMDITERKRAEEESRRSQQLLQAIVDNSPAYIYVKDLEGCFVLVNRGLAKLFESTPEEIYGKTTHDLVEKKAADRHRANDLEVLESGKPLMREERNPQSDGVHTYYSIKFPLMGEDGKPFALGGISTDITEKKRAEEEVLKEKFFSDAAIDAMPGIFYLYNEQGHFLRWNKNFERVSGYSAEEIKRMHPLDFFAGEEKELLEQRIAEVFAQGESSVEASFVAKDGSAAPYFFTGRRILLDQTTCLVGVGIDIMERKRVEEALFESEAKLSGIIESAMDAIITVDASQRVVLFNKAAEKMFQYSFAEVMGQPLDRFIPERFRAGHSSHIREFGETGVTTRTMAGARAVNGLRADGTEFPLEASISQIEARGQKLYTVILRDITERKRAEQLITRSREQLRALTAHLQEVREEERTRISREVHDVLGQLLTALKMDISMCAKKLSDYESEEGRANLVSRINAMQELADDIIKTVQHISAELRPGVLDTLGLVAAVEWQARDFEERTNIVCACDLPPASIEISSEKATAMFRIFQEVLTNVARHSLATHVQINLRSENGDVVLSVRDNGRGITEEELSDTASLGLLGMRERAQIFGGDIVITGERGKGTEVEARLPMRNGKR